MMQTVEKIFEYIWSKKTIALLAPSFSVDFLYPDIVKKLRCIGFDRVVELTYAAKLINHKYRELLLFDEKKQIICTNCPTVAQYIFHKYPQHKHKLANIASPMVLMSRIAKKTFGDNFNTVFIGPCLSKKQEANLSWDVDLVITFKELQNIFDNYEIILDGAILDMYYGYFDKFYNNYTKIYPLSWAVVETMHYKKILEKHQFLIVDGISELDLAIEKMERDPNIRFIDALSCIGGCIGWPWICSKEKTYKKNKKIQEYRESSYKEKTLWNLWKITDAPDIIYKNIFLSNLT